MEYFETPSLEIKEGEYADEKGFPICSKCNKPRYFEFEGKLVRVPCECQQVENEQREMEEQKRQQEIKAQERRERSLLGKRYANATFETADINENNKKAFMIAKSYAEKYKEMLEKGYGFYVYGNAGGGKTHLLACVCNYLTDHLQQCIFTNFSNILNDIRQSYNSPIQPENIIDKYSKVPFLFIDDFGKESYKKTNGDMGWMDEQMFIIFNNRYNNMLPTIISSNYSIDKLTNEFSLDSALADRIREMATRVIHLQDDNRRRPNKEDWN